MRSVAALAFCVLVWVGSLSSCTVLEVARPAPETELPSKPALPEHSAGCQGCLVPTRKTTVVADPTEQLAVGSGASTAKQLPPQTEIVADTASASPLSVDIPFPHASAHLTDAARARLVSALQGASIERVELRGYTSGSIDSVPNLRLATARAETVRQFVRSHLAPAAVVEISPPQGSRLPHPSDCQRHNVPPDRRVEVIVERSRRV
jgi:outer membrane protein OmpA-like peptidoglycan-associated protein